MRNLLFLSICLFSFNLSALEIDEKLTLRVVKISKSGKTMLINRGIEDGLVKGDHAKFFLSVGVVARGVMIQGSPTRSVWSLYRLVNRKYIRDEQVMNLKITPAVKITKDESRMLVKDDTTQVMNQDPRDLGIPLAPGAQDLTEEEKLDFKQRLDNDGMSFTVDLSKKDNEIYFSAFYSFMTSETTPDISSVSSYSSTDNLLSLSFGYEKYYTDESKWFSRISLFGQITSTSVASLAFDGTSSENTTTEYGGGVHLYPSTRPTKVARFIPYLGLATMMGTSTSARAPGNSGGTSASSVDGSLLSYYFSGGFKYYSNEGFGARIQLDYIQQGIEYAKDPSSNTAWVKRTAGPRIVVGLSSRF